MSKLIIVVVPGGCGDLVQQLVDGGYNVTKFSSIGGFLRHRSTTLLVGVSEEQVQPALALIRAQCPTPSGSSEHSATLFVLNAGQLVTI